MWNTDRPRASLVRLRRARIELQAAALGGNRDPQRVTREDQLGGRAVDGVDERGVVLARGLINSREHLESLFEAKRLGVASIQEYLEHQRQDRAA